MFQRQFQNKCVRNHESAYMGPNFRDCLSLIHPSKLLHHLSVAPMFKSQPRLTYELLSKFTEAVSHPGTPPPHTHTPCCHTGLADQFLWLTNWLWPVASLRQPWPQLSGGIQSADGTPGRLVKVTCRGCQETLRNSRKSKERHFGTPTSKWKPRFLSLHPGSEDKKTKPLQRSKCPRLEQFPSSQH